MNVYIDPNFVLHKLESILLRLDSLEREIRGVKAKTDSLEMRFKTLIEIRDAKYLEFKERLAASEKYQENLQVELGRARAIAAAMRSCNKALAHADSEEDFLGLVCDFIVRGGGFQMVWIGYALDDAEKSIRPVAYSGFDEGYIDQLRLSWADTMRGRGPTGRAIRNRTPEVVQDMSTDPGFEPWLEEARKRGYASSLALPLILPDGQVLGAVNLYSKQVNHFAADEILLLSGMANDIAAAIQSQRHAAINREEELKNQRDYKSRIAISALLEMSIQPISLQSQLERALDLIISVPWLMIEPMGCIFIADDAHQKLHLVAQRNLATPLLELCHQVDYGTCLCGRAAARREIIFSSCLDEDHDIRFDAIQPHGHFCVPIKSAKKLYGVLNLYTTHGAERSESEEAFLVSVAHTLAGIIERKRTEEKINRMATTDALTRLPNCTTFLEQLHHEVKRAKRQEESLAVMFIDLDGFKLVNDRNGHKVGDALLVQVGERIKGSLRESDVVGRLGGDEFAVVLPGVTSEQDAILAANKIIQAINRPLIVNEVTLNVGASIGISMYPGHGEEAELLLHRADLSLYAVKRGGRNHCRIYAEAFESLMQGVADPESDQVQGRSDSCQSQAGCGE
ncbi:MAG: GGDEF domain-containing protein [Magnetococcales bacterium]|nr:GGDEF domain-containing protein [Magnetococcales bacterium]